MSSSSPHIHGFKRPINFFIFVYALSLPLYILVAVDYLNQSGTDEVQRSTAGAFWAGAVGLSIITCILIYHLVRPKKRKMLFERMD